MYSNWRRLGRLLVAAALVMLALSAAVAPTPASVGRHRVVRHGAVLAPRALHVTRVAATAVSVSWRRPTGGSIVGFEVSRNGARPRITRVARVTYTGLACDTTYRIAVRTRGRSGLRSRSVARLVTTAACPAAEPGGAAAPASPALAPPSGPSAPGDTTASRPQATAPQPSARPDTAPPTTPANLTASVVTPTSITLTWTASTDDVAIANYEVLVNGARQAPTTTSTSFTLSALACGTKYKLGVEAVDTSGNVSKTATSKATTSPCAASGGSQGCPSKPLQGVQVPGKLKVLDRANPCRTATGVVTSTARMSDGDCHIRIKLDAAYSSLLRSGNNGALVAEVIPNHRIPIPKAGSRVSVTGTWVEDVPNAWNELHPVWSFQVLSGSTGSC
jgi:chitodextrinase